ncbi:glycosyltransferase family 4 protein [Actinomycetospora cinnamomea]|uniref:(1->4)-alpha-D-glucan synthase (UDP-glucose) n=1 Tax=Actinomycetospora cinnamomea TaxID=663609 RepID=A0A2U1FR55_9PSEU|nr:glycosyltransferase family 4 protein [Actinomycetospora cinnamomea]PVZ14668.1 (1->4)-alpha-D-glucan synthase (UDP-glucose) [Actinomycetospora cinnamomea]
MRVLMLSWEYPPVVVGGLGRHVHALSVALAEAGHDVVVVARHPAGTDAETHPTGLEHVDGVRVLRVGEDPPHLEFVRDLVAWTLGLGHAMLRAAAGLLRDWTPHVVHAHDWLVAHAAIGLADLTGAPLVATIHATEGGRHGGWLSQPLNQQVHSVEWWLTRRADAVVTCSQAMRAEVTGLFDVDPDDVTVLHNGIEPQGWVRPRRVADGPPTLLYLGRLEWEKGVHDLVAALPAIRRAHAGTRLLVAGTGSCSDWLAERARAARVRRSVRLLGHVDDATLRDLLASADAAVLPSRYEPFGITALEAAAAGAPLVASRAGGLGEVVVDGVTGLSFAPGDVPGLAAAVVRCLDDPVAARTRADAARARLDTDFAWPAIADDTAALYAATRPRPPTILGRPKIPTGNVFGT